LRAKLSGLQKAQENAAVTKTLPDGRIRYYTQEVPARTEGVTRGASFATERGNRGQTTFCIYGVFVTIVQSFKKRVLRGVVCRPKAVFS